MCYYNPIPARLWSRVQNQCTFTDPDTTYDQIYIPLTGQVVSQVQANYEEKLIHKGNILQYKANSARFTKSQKYSQLARMTGPNRTKVFATQSQTYTNPNTTGLLRVGYSTYSFPNQIPGAPNNISGPFAYGIPNPNDCSGNSIQEGGTLVCGTFANPCSGEIYTKTSTNTIISNPASASDVPGNSVLSWNNKVNTWFPKNRYSMNNSSNKWPVNAKEFVSALHIHKPSPPFLYFNFFKKIYENLQSKDSYLNLKNKELYIENFKSSDFVLIKYHITFDWKLDYIFKVDSFNIYLNNNFYKNIKNDNTYKFTLFDFDKTNCFISMTSVLNNIESSMSNYIFFNDIDASLNEPVTPPPIDTSNCCLDLTNVNNLLTIIDAKINNGLFKLDDIKSNINTQFDNISYNINNKIDNLDSNINTQFDNISYNINNKIDNLDSNINTQFEQLKYDLSGNFNNDCFISDISNLLDNKLDNIYNLLGIKIDNIGNNLDTIYSSITNITNIVSSIFDKVSLYKDCSGCCGCSSSNDMDSSCNSGFGCNCTFYNALFKSGVISVINNYVLLYISTIDEDTDTYIPLDVYDNFNAELMTLKDLFVVDPSCCFINIIDIYSNILTLVKFGFDKKNTLKQTLINTEKWHKDSIILNDRKKLAEYVSSLNKSFDIMQLTITASKLTLKPQYLIYHNLYGIPNSLKYDPVLMKQILSALGTIDNTTLVHC